MECNSCLDKNLSRQVVTFEFWKANSTREPLGIATGTTILVFFLLGLPSNTLIIASILLQKLYLETTHLLLFSLACADTLMCLLVMPLIITAGFAGEFIIGSSDYARCKVCQTGVIYVAITMFSLHLLALLSFDRFMFVKFPLRYDELLTRRAVIVTVIAISVLSILLGVLPLFGVGEIYFNTMSFVCAPRFDNRTDVTENIYYLILLVLEALVLPVPVLTITTTWVLCIANKHIKKIYGITRNRNDTMEQGAYHDTLRSKLHQEKFRKQLHLVRVFGIIFVSHIITWIPLIVRVIQASAGYVDFPLWSHYVVSISVISYPILHPVIEMYTLPEIRKPFGSFLAKCCKRKCRCSVHDICTA